MKSSPPIPRQRITRHYQWAVGCYVAPMVLFVISLIDSATFDLTNNFFAGAAMLSLLPGGSIGLFLSARGMVMAIQNRDTIKKDIGYANLLMGTLIAIAGLMVMGFIYLL